MPLFSHPEPVILKESSSATAELEQMRDLLLRVAPADQERIERNIRLVEAGIRGEDQVIFELRNSHLPIYVLHDLYLEHDDLSGQIDFLVIMPYVAVVIECKNLVGNISVDSKGEFVRQFGSGRSCRKEGIYSPITQNERHLNLMRAIRSSEKGTLSRIAFEHWFSSLYKSVVVLANPKTVLNDRYAKREVKDQIIRADALINYLKQLNEEGRKAGNGKLSDKQMRSDAERWLAHDSPHKREVASGYQLRDVTVGASGSDPAEASGVPLCPICGAPMVKRTAHKGPRAGKPFWGCSNYPQCHGIVNIEG